MFCLTILSRAAPPLVYGYVYSLHVQAIILGVGKASNVSSNSMGLRHTVCYRVNLCFHIPPIKMVVAEIACLSRCMLLSVVYFPVVYDMCATLTRYPVIFSLLTLQWIFVSLSTLLGLLALPHVHRL